MKNYTLVNSSSLHLSAVLLWNGFEVNKYNSQIIYTGYSRKHKLKHRGK